MSRNKERVTNSAVVKVSFNVMDIRDKEWLQGEPDNVDFIRVTGLFSFGRSILICN